jgi:hypothetical protein
VLHHHTAQRDSTAGDSTAAVSPQTVPACSSSDGE